jgi:hypothetical protein
MIPDSHPDACQASRAAQEPFRDSSILDNGATINRRSLMNMLVSTAALVAGSTAAASTASGSQPRDDSALLVLEEQIFEQRAAAAAYDDEIIRLDGIWTGVFLFLDQEIKEGRCDLTQDELWRRIKELPESKEHTRLVKLQGVHFTEMDKLIEKMWATPAHTPQGRQAKLWVLLGTIMPADWCEHDGRADYEIRRARDLMIEFVGGEPAEQLRDQFAV